MSHFTKMEIKALEKNEAELVASLENHYGKGTVKTYSPAQKLQGYDASANKSAHLIITKDVVRRVEKTSGYNDIGFERGKDGTYTLHYDPMDIPKTSLDKVMQDYAERVASKTMKAKGFSMRRELQKDGQVKLLFSKMG
jgi:hypothetical protein